MISLLKYLSIYLLSAFKFFVGPLLGVSYGIDPIVSVLLAILGMMSTVLMISFFGKQIKTFAQRVIYRNKPVKKFNKKSRRFVRIWRRFGLAGVSMLTPVLFTPVVGAVLVNMVNGRKRDIFKWMFISAASWGILTIFMLKFGAHLFS